MTGPRTLVRTPLVRRQTGYDLDLIGYDTEHISLGSEVLYRNPYPGRRWMDEEIAMATLLERTASWVRGEGPEPYPLAEGAQDQQIALAIEESADSDTTVTTSSRGLELSRVRPEALPFPAAARPRGCWACSGCAYPATRRSPPGRSGGRGRSRRAGAGALVDSAELDAPAAALSSWSCVRGPMIGAVTAGWCSSQARPNVAGFVRRASSARSSYAWICVPMLRKDSCAARPSSRPDAGRSPCLSTPPSRPPCSGDQGMTPSP